MPRHGRELLPLAPQPNYKRIRSYGYTSRELLSLAPLLYRDLHASLAKTATTSESGQRCYPHRADGRGTYTGCNFRAYSEMFFSGALTEEMTEAIYAAGLGERSCEVGRV